jgi:hypothetical protein
MMRLDFGRDRPPVPPACGRAPGKARPGLGFPMGLLLQKTPRPAVGSVGVPWHTGGMNGRAGTGASAPTEDLHVPCRACSALPLAKIPGICIPDGAASRHEGLCLRLPRPLKALRHCPTVGGSR